MIKCNENGIEIPELWGINLESCQCYGFFAIANIQLLETTNLSPTLSAEPCILWSLCSPGA